MVTRPVLGPSELFGDVALDRVPRDDGGAPSQHSGAGIGDGAPPPHHGAAGRLGVVSCFSRRGEILATPVELYRTYNPQTYTCNIYI